MPAIDELGNCSLYLFYVDLIDFITFFYEKVKLAHEIFKTIVKDL